MRTGSCIVQQGLTPEAATIVKQAVTLARRRGHAQVTPLHVANVMLSSSAGLFRAACLQSHSHPLRCKALELCFNVALNRLPASAACAPMLAPYHAHRLPSLSNALVAAFKRAQANQRRGSIETQPQPLLAVKIEVEQLVISILDDPSVSRVMREAGFCSTQVKSNVEQAVSMEICAVAPPNPDPSKSKEAISTPFATPQASKTKSLVQAKSDDVACVVEALVSRGRRSLVVVGECLDTIDAVVRGVTDRADKGEVPEVLKNAQFITLPLFSFRKMSREEVDQKVGELRCLLKSCCVGRGAVLCLGNLNWVAEYRASHGEKGISLYCPVEHVIMEIRSLVFDGIGVAKSNWRFWLMGIATYQTYMKCKVGHPSLETLWGLQPLTIPVCSLGLSLNCDSGSESQLKSKLSGDGHQCSLMGDGFGSQFTRYEDFSINPETEAQGLIPITSYSYSLVASTLPSWLQQYKEENKRRTSDDQSCHLLEDPYKKWNSIRSSAPKRRCNPSNFSSSSPCDSSSSSSISSYDQRPLSLHQNQQHWLLSPEVKNPSTAHQIWLSEITGQGFEHNSRSSMQKHAGQSTLPYVNLNSNPNSSTSSSTMEMEYIPKFKELNAENLKILCSALEKNASWQQEIIMDIASTILQCRSGMIKRKDKFKPNFENKEVTWLFFQGGDADGKKSIAKELASLIFCSQTNFVSISLSKITSPRSDSVDYLCKKLFREEASHNYLERLFEVINENPHRVILIEDIDRADYQTLAGIKAGIQRGKIRSCSSEEVSVSDAIIILSCKSFRSGLRVFSPPVKQKAAESEEDREEVNEKEVGMHLSLDLNLCTADDDLDDHSFDYVGLLELVDQTFFFQLPEDL